MRKELIFSVTIDDMIIQTFRSGGKGGQYQNKTDSGVRLIHPPSGARAESREHRDQPANKKAAFLKLVKSPKFKSWYRVQVAKKLGQESVEEIVDRMMKKVEDFLIEEKDENGRWTKSTLV